MMVIFSVRPNSQDVASLRKFKVPNLPATRINLNKLNQLNVNHMRSRRC